ncbi:HAD-IA family hydrolase [Alkanindiges sp. WGS2144]|uniref:HAD-IA family hydrolase n=1 Tax=Alkanindiges sp. WGS2144 TaxID=3366808 RepID=UPI0037502500
MSRRFDLVIFDWDGTLFDSVSQIVSSLQWAAQQYQIDLCPEAARNIIGLGLPEAMQALFPQHVELQPYIQAEYASHYVANSHTQRWFTGVDDLLEQLTSCGMLLAVATGKSRAGLDRVLVQTESERYFVATRCANETCSKPDPLMLEQLLAQTGVSVERAVMVGDSSYDMEMAQRMNMARIGVSYGVHSADVLEQYQPMAVVHSIAELGQVLLKLSA